MEFSPVGDLDREILQMEHGIFAISGILGHFEYRNSKRWPKLLEMLARN